MKLNEVGKEINRDKDFTDIANESLKNLNGTDGDEKCIKAFKRGVLEVARNAKEILYEGDIDDWTQFLENLSSNAYRLDELEV